MYNPYHPVTNLMLRLYTFESFLYKTLNHATRYGDESKVDTLGPYSQVLNEIIRHSGGSRKDIEKKDMVGIILYRGCNMTDA